MSRAANISKWDRKCSSFSLFFHTINYNFFDVFTHIILLLMLFTLIVVTVILKLLTEAICFTIIHQTCATFVNYKESKLNLACFANYLLIYHEILSRTQYINPLCSLQFCILFYCQTPSSLV